VGDREILETYLNLASKTTSETDVFSSWDKIFVDQSNCRLYNLFKIHTHSEKAINELLHKAFLKTASEVFGFKNNRQVEVNIIMHFNKITITSNKTTFLNSDMKIEVLWDFTPCQLIVTGNLEMHSTSVIRVNLSKIVITFL
jgi:hypothetical protein